MLSFLSELSSETPESRITTCLVHIDLAICSSVLRADPSSIEAMLKYVSENLNEQEFLSVVHTLERKATYAAKSPYGQNHKYAYDYALSLKEKNNNLAHPGQIVFEPEDF
jgi:hypothetical protein